MKTYEIESHCPHCDADTLQLFTDSEHERDSSYDRQECLTCHWWKIGLSDEWRPPNELDEE